MQRACTKCKKPIATVSVECECSRVFHPGCIKPYASSNRYADACCKSLAFPSTILLTPEADDTAPSFDLVSMASPQSVGTQPRSQPQSQLDATTNELLLRLCEQIRESDARLSAFMEDQRRTNKEINDKLSRLSCIAETVAQNGKRIVKLEQSVSELAREVRVLKERKTAPSVPKAQENVKNELVISGVPTALSVTPAEFVKNVFEALDVKELSCHVLNVRPMVRKSLPVANQNRSSRAAETVSLAVTLTSGAVRDGVISKKRVKRVLRQSEVCGNDSDRNIFVNEMLPKATYDLLQSTRRVAREKSYKYVWMKSGRICVRLSDGKPIISVDSESDLAKLV